MLQLLQCHLSFDSPVDLRLKGLPREEFRRTDLGRDILPYASADLEGKAGAGLDIEAVTYRSVQGSWYPMLSEAMQGHT